MSGIGGLYDGVDITKVMYGEDAMHVPFNMILQATGVPHKYAGVFQFEHEISKLEKMFGNTSHVLILGDAIIRPRVAIRTKSLQGVGISGIYRDGFLTVMDNLRSPGTEILMGIPK